MEAGIRSVVLSLLALCAVGYTLWSACCLRRLARGTRKAEGGNPAPRTGGEPRREIIGKSRFVLPRSQSQTQAATTEKTGKGDEKADIFAGASVPEHPRQIPPEKLDEVFGAPPAGEANEPDEYSLPLYEEPDYAAEDEDDEDGGPLPLAGRPRATGESFEQIGEAYRTVVHGNPLTDEKQQEVGRTLLGLKRTDMFEAIVSAAPDGNAKVSVLIDAYLAAYERKVAAEAAGSPSPQAPVPEGFDVRKFA